MSKKLSEKIKDLIMTHITNPTSVGYGKTWDWFEKHSHFGEFYRGAVELEQRIAELEEQLLKVSKAYADMSYAQQVNKHKESEE